MIALLAGGGLNLLAVNPGLMIWTLITFLIVLTILWFFAWKPIATALDSRSDKIESDLQKSQELREEAEQLLADYKAKLDSAKEEAAQLIEQARKTAEEQKDKILKETREQAEVEKQRSLKDIEQAKLSAINDLEDHVVDTTITVLSRIMGSHVDASSHKAVIQDEIKAIQKS